MVEIITYERSTLVNSEKYIGLDVHQATISVAVLDSTGKVVMESITACTLAESPSDPLHRKLRQLRCLRCRFDCFYEKVIKVKADVAALHSSPLFVCVWDVSSTVPPSLGFLPFLFFVAFATFP
jgi:hypothetical protein